MKNKHSSIFKPSHDFSDKEIAIGETRDVRGMLVELTEKLDNYIEHPNNNTKIKQLAKALRSTASAANKLADDLDKDNSTEENE